MEILNKYKNYNIRNVKIDSFSNLGIYYCNTNPIKNLGDFNSNDEYLEFGFNIYIAKYDDNKALKIYRDMNPLTYKFSTYRDYNFVNKCQEKQPNIKKSLLPTGVVTFDDKVVGIEIPFFPNENTLEYEIEHELDFSNLKKYLLEIIEIIQELYDNGILYLDVHLRNFLINKEKDIVDIIDFDEEFIKFENEYGYIELYNNMIDNFKTCILNKIEQNYDIKFNLDNICNLDDINNEIMKIEIGKKI